MPYMWCHLETLCEIAWKHNVIITYVDLLNYVIRKIISFLSNYTSFKYFDMDKIAIKLIQLSLRIKAINHIVINYKYLESEYFICILPSIVNKYRKKSCRLQKFMMDLQLIMYVRRLNLLCSNCWIILKATMTW